MDHPAGVSPSPCRKMSAPRFGAEDAMAATLLVLNIKVKSAVYKKRKERIEWPVNNHLLAASLPVIASRFGRRLNDWVVVFKAIQSMFLILILVMCDGCDVRCAMCDDR